METQGYREMLGERTSGPSEQRGRRVELVETEAKFSDACGGLQEASAVGT
jgi:hypothetical protein